VRLPPVATIRIAMSFAAVLAGYGIGPRAVPEMSAVSVPAPWKVGAAIVGYAGSRISYTFVAAIVNGEPELTASPSPGIVNSRVVPSVNASQSASPEPVALLPDCAPSVILRPDVSPLAIAQSPLPSPAVRV